MKVKKNRIYIREQTGHGFWAVVYPANGETFAVQSPGIYGFETRAEARAEANRRLAPRTAPHAKKVAK